MIHFENNLKKESSILNTRKVKNIFEIVADFKVGEEMQEINHIHDIY